MPERFFGVLAFPTVYDLADRFTELVLDSRHTLSHYSWLNGAHGDEVLS